MTDSRSTTIMSFHRPCRRGSMIFAIDLGQSASLIVVFSRTVRPMIERLTGRRRRVSIQSHALGRIKIDVHKVQGPADDDEQSRKCSQHLR